MQGNEKFVQLQGPFKSREELVDIILEGTNSRYIQHLGIQANQESQCSINGKIFEIGKTEVLELTDVNINSLYFLKAQPETTIIDCVLY